MAKIVVRAPNWLGDAVMCTPFLRRLIESRPGDEVHVLCRPLVREIFLPLPGLRGALTFQKGERLRDMVRRLRSEKFTAGYVLPPSFSSALLFFLAGIPERLGYATDFRRLLLTRAFSLDERFHYVRRYLGLLGEAGRDAGPGDLFYPKPLTVLQGARLFLSSRGIPFRAPALAVAPGSQAPARRWFPERYAELINGFSEEDWPTIFLLGAPGDSPMAKQVEDLSRRKVVNLCGETNLVVLGDLLKECAALVTNESGLMHVGWAVGVPTVVLAGPSEPRLTSPFGSQVRVLQHREVPCVPCVRNDCYRPAMEYKECMKKIGVEEVRIALRDLLKAVIPA